MALVSMVNCDYFSVAVKITTGIEKILVKFAENSCIYVMLFLKQYEIVATFVTS